MKQIHEYPLSDEEIKTMDKIIHIERKPGFELASVFYESTPHGAWTGDNGYILRFKEKEKVEKKK